MTDRPIFLDNNSTTFPAPEAVEAVLPLFGEIYGNPSSTHSFGQKVRHEIELARENVAKLLNCKPSEIVFNSGATEGNNTAIYAALDGMPERKHIITTRVEHSSVLEVIRYLEEAGYRITELNVDRLGHIDLDELKNEISGDTALVSIMWANNETGVINPINAAGDIAKQFGALVHVDAVQAAGKLKIDLKDEQAIDFLTISGHKFHGLKGSGALFVREKAPYLLLIRGGHHENGRRAGTENAMGIVAMGAAAGLVNRDLDKHVEQMKKLPARVTRKREIYRRYAQGLDGVAGITLFAQDLENTAPWFYDTLAVDRAALMDHLKAKGIGTRVMYPPINRQVAYDVPGTHPVSDMVGEKGLWLPSMVQLTDAQVDRITGEIRAFYASR